MVSRGGFFCFLLGAESFMQVPRAGKAWELLDGSDWLSCIHLELKGVVKSLASSMVFLSVGGGWHGGHLLLVPGKGTVA